MNDKKIREKLLEQAGIVVGKLRQEDTHGGALALIASSPFTDGEAADYMINAIIATGTPETLALAYELPLAAAQVMHSKAVANVTIKKREGKSNGVSGIAEALKAMFGDKLEKAKAEADAPDPDCQCPGCKLGRIMQGMKQPGVGTDPDGTPTVAFEFGTKSPEEAERVNQQFVAEVAKGRNPFEVAEEMGGRIADPDTIAAFEKEGKATIQHIDVNGNFVTKH